MCPNDIQEFRRQLELLCIAFDRQASGSLIDVYAAGLSDLTIEAISYAVEQSIKKATYFPRVAELRQLIEGGLDDRASHAWAAFLEAAADGGTSSVCFSDRATAAAVDAVFGGWIQACGMLSAGWIDEDTGDHKGGCTDEMAAHYQKSFLRQYTAASHQAREVELYRPGRSEMSLRERGASWADRMPTLMQPVILVGQAKAVSFRLPFDVASGQLTEAARAAIAHGFDAVKSLAEASARRLAPVGLPALPPATEELIPMPADVAQAFVDWRETSKLPELEPEEVMAEVLAEVRERFSAFPSHNEGQGK